MDVAEIASQRRGVNYTIRVQTRPGVVEDWEGCVLEGVVHVGFPDEEGAPHEYVKFQLAAASPASLLLEPLRVVELIRES